MGNTMTAGLLLAVAGLAVSVDASAQTTDTSTTSSTQGTDAQMSRIQARMDAMEQEMKALLNERDQMKQELANLHQQQDQATKQQKLNQKTVVQVSGGVPLAQTGGGAGVAKGIDSAARQTVFTDMTPAGMAPDALKEGLPPLEMYGVLDEFYSIGKYGKGTSSRLDSSGARGSRIGFRGEHVINSDLTLEYELEAGINVDSGTQPTAGSLFNRNSFIGLESNYGTFRFGRMDSMMFVMLGRMDAMDATTQTSALLNLAPFAPRYSNVIAYISPKLAGAITLQAQYGLAETNDGSDKNGNWHVSAEYEKGPVYAGVTHEEIVNATGNVKTKYTLAGGSYDFGRLKLFTGYHIVRVSDGSREGNTWSVSALYRVTPVDWVSFGIGALDDLSSEQNAAAQVGLLYQHLWSKSTVLYAGISKLRNDHKSNLTLNGSAVAGVPLAYPGYDPEALQLGLRYSF